MTHEQELRMEITAETRGLLEDVLDRLYASSAAFPQVREFRRARQSQGTVIGQLVEHGYLKLERERYWLTRKGLLECRSATAKKALEDFDSLLPRLQDVYKKHPRRTWTVADLAQEISIPALELARTLALFNDLAIQTAQGRHSVAGQVRSIQLTESILGIDPLERRDSDEPDAPSATVPNLRIKNIELSGYRPFSCFSAQPGDLTVIIGANASGKSSLFDFLRFLSFAGSNPLPPEIDPRCVGRRLFYSNGPDKIELALEVDDGESKPLRYEVEIHGPIGAPKVANERLATTEPVSDHGREPFVLLSFHNGRGAVRDPVERKLKRPEWTVLPNELALRRALDPTLITLARFQAFITSWRFYSGFDVSISAAMRRPVPSDPAPTLAEDGSNLSAVLFSLTSEHPAAWQELETHLRSAIPGFVSLAVKPRGGPGTVMAIWREEGIKDELTLADLSDGTLRFLCWATLCLSPVIPPLICIDEPELGLHPRVLPVLAGILRIASARSQILVATHSPYFLSQFKLDEIAVMKKEAGKAVFRRPATSESLRREIEELGSDALALMHVSDELEARS